MFFKSHNTEDKPTYERKLVEIWQCPNCIGWMQKEFALSQQPDCPLCTEMMIEGTREINVPL
ncbi:MAG: cold-inducible protein YdjO-related protein [Thermotaleaceae bacterium]